MNHGKEIDGVVSIVPTPFRSDESIDLEALGRCVEFAVRCGLSAVCLPAYASEFYKLAESERREVVETAIRVANGRLAIVAQSNHPSLRVACEIARQHEQSGADLISFAVPRLFALPAGDLLDYCTTLCRSVSLPVLIQDFNPGGATVGARFARDLADACPNFSYLKLEEPLMSRKVVAIREATEGRIGVLEGWGGMYMLDLVPAGICGIMPGLAAADLLQRIWKLATGGNRDEALDLFQVVLPQLSFALQNMELFLVLEKKLLAARGVLPEESTWVRRPTWTPDAMTLEHGLRLNDRVMDLCHRLGLPESV